MGDKLAAQSREAEAIENYKLLLQEAPDYPGRPAIEARLNALKQKSTNTNPISRP